MRAGEITRMRTIEAEHPAAHRLVVNGPFDEASLHWVQRDDEHLAYCHERAVTSSMAAKKRLMTVAALRGRH